uniref:Uncharacterized protein n=1 Tax=Oryza punctata TaxID=4537 RepID=A0A0E0L380_ORYPU
MVVVQTVHAALLPSTTTTRRRASPRRLPRRSPICARGGSRSSSGQGAGPSETSPSRGHENGRVQEALARVAEIQILKVRIASFLDDCSENLLWLAENADAELDATAQDGLRMLDGAAGDEIMERMYCNLGHFDEPQTEKWIDLIGLGIDEGASVESIGEEAKHEHVPDVLVAKESGWYRTRRNVYLGVMGLIWVGLMQTTVFAAPYVELDKFAALCLIFLALIVQVCFKEETDKEQVCVNHETEISGRQK